MEAQHRAVVPEEVVSVLEAVAAMAAGLVVLAAGLAAGLVVAAAGQVLVAVVLAAGPTVLIRLVPRESHDPACFSASRS